MKRREREESREDMKAYVREITKDKPVEKNRELARKIGDLFGALLRRQAYRNFEAKFAAAEAEYEKAKKAYCRLPTNGRLERLLHADWWRGELRREHENTDIDEIERTLKEYEEFLDKKYWNLSDLLLMEHNIRYGVYNSVEEAVEDIERRKKTER